MNIIRSDRHKNTVKFIYPWMDTFFFFSLTTFHNGSLTLVENFSRDIYSLEPRKSGCCMLFMYKNVFCSERTTPFPFPFLCSLFSIPNVFIMLCDFSFKNSGLYCDHSSNRGQSFDVYILGHFCLFSFLHHLTYL